MFQCKCWPGMKVGMCPSVGPQQCTTSRERESQTASSAPSDHQHLPSSAAGAQSTDRPQYRRTKGRSHSISTCCCGCNSMQQLIERETATMNQTRSFHAFPVDCSPAKRHSVNNGDFRSPDRRGCTVLRKSVLVDTNHHPHYHHHHHEPQQQQPHQHQQQQQQQQQHGNRGGEQHRSQSDPSDRRPPSPSDDDARPPHRSTVKDLIRSFEGMASKNPRGATPSGKRKVISTYWRRPKNPYGDGYHLYHAMMCELRDVVREPPQPLPSATRDIRCEVTPKRAPPPPCSPSVDCHLGSLSYQQSKMYPVLLEELEEVLSDLESPAVEFPPCEPVKLSTKWTGLRLPGSGSLLPRPYVGPYTQLQLGKGFNAYFQKYSPRLKRASSKENRAADVSLDSDGAVHVTRQ